jgi:hypothetical protein
MTAATTGRRQARPPSGPDSSWSAWPSRRRRRAPREPRRGQRRDQASTCCASGDRRAGRRASSTCSFRSHRCPRASKLPTSRVTFRDRLAIDTRVRAGRPSSPRAPDTAQARRTRVPDRRREGGLGKRLGEGEPRDRRSRRCPARRDPRVIASTPLHAQCDRGIPVVEVRPRSQRPRIGGGHGVSGASACPAGSKSSRGLPSGSSSWMHGHPAGSVEGFVIPRPMRPGEQLPTPEEAVDEGRDPAISPARSSGTGISASAATSRPIASSCASSSACSASSTSSRNTASTGRASSTAW